MTNIRLLFKYKHEINIKNYGQIVKFNKNDISQINVPFPLPNHAQFYESSVSHGCTSRS